MSFRRHLLLVAGKELRETLRDRRTLAVMILFPLVVYPLVSLVTAQVMAARVSRAEERTARVAVNGPSPLADRVRERLRAHGKGLTLGPPAPISDLATNRLDAIVEVTPPSGKAPNGRPAARILFDETREESRTAQERANAALAGADPGCEPAYVVSTQGIAPRNQLGGYLLSRILPLIVVVMVMLGAFHPAIDITAGERERSTLETTLSAPISRRALMGGKVLAVAALAAITGFLNLASMSLTVLQGARLVANDVPFAVPWTAAAAALTVVPPTAFLFASVMVAVGSIARSFKEAQTLLTPVYFLCMAPSMIAALGDFELRGVALFLPGVNVTLLARDLVIGRAQVLATAVVFATTVGYGAVALVFASRFYDSERLLGSDEAGLGLRAWLRRVFTARRDSAPGSSAPEIAPPTPTAGHAVALYAIAWLLLLLFAPLQAETSLGPTTGLLLFEWLGLGGLVLIHARGTGQPLRTILRLERPPAAALLAAVLIGISAWVVIGLLASWIAPAPKELVEKLRRVITPPEGGRGLALTLFLMALTPAVCEEALFRGPILRGLRSRFPAAGAAIVTGLLFGLYHGDVWRFLPTAAIGVLLSVVALGAGSILPAMLAHFVNNACLVVLARQGVDDATTLGGWAAAAVFGGGVIVLGTGLWLLAWSQRTRRVM
jgi:sodium transport system permease protein